jgi:hypothetical protein
MTASAKAALLEEQIVEAGALVLQRVSDGGISITAKGKPVVTCLRSDVFARAISELVISEVDVARVSRVELTPVAPQIMFAYAPIPRFYNVAAFSADNVRLGGREGLKHQGEVAKSLVAHLTPANGYALAIFYPQLI